MIEPAPEAAMQSQAMTQPPLCFIDEIGDQLIAGLHLTVWPVFCRAWGSWVLGALLKGMLAVDVERRESFPHPPVNTGNHTVSKRCSVCPKPAFL